LACPNEPHCYGGTYDDKEFRVPINGDKINMQHLKNDDATDDFIRRDVCGFIVKGPSRANDGDLIKVRLRELKNGSAYFHSGVMYDYDMLDSRTKMSTSKTLTATIPDDVYISVFATKYFFATFYIEAWYEEAPEEEVIV
jgi:hypothetical protein